MVTLIAQTDPIVKYLPRLAGTRSTASLGCKTFCKWLRGLRGTKTMRTPNRTLRVRRALNGVALTDYLAQLPRMAPSRVTRFNYNTAESNLLG